MFMRLTAIRDRGSAANTAQFRAARRCGLRRYLATGWRRRAGSAVSAEQSFTSWPCTLRIGKNIPSACPWQARSTPGLPLERARRAPSHRYDGYTSCPLVTARDRMLLAEFDYDLNPAPTFPLIDPFKERRTMWVFKRYGLPPVYWHGMLTGRL